VIAPPSPESLPLSSIPHPPFAWPDALMLLALVAAALIIALSVRARRKE
jgi:hypothetical protein